MWVRFTQRVYFIIEIKSTRNGQKRKYSNDNQDDNDNKKKNGQVRERECERLSNLYMVR